MITARMLLDRMTPTTLLVFLQDISEVEDDQDTAAVRSELIDQLIACIGEADAIAALNAAGLKVTE